MSKLTKSLKRYLAILGLFSVLACSFYSLNASALDIVQNVDFQESIQSPYFRLTFTDDTLSPWSNSTYDGGSTSKNTGLIWLRSANNSTPSSISSGRFVSAIVRFSAPGYFNMINTSGAFTASSYNSSCPLISIDNVTSSFYNDDSSNATTDSWNVFIITCKYTGSGDISIPINVRTSSASFHNWRLLPISFTIWSKAPNGASSSDVEAVKNAVNSMSSAIQNKQDAIYNKLNQLNLSINDLKSAQEQANDDANERYQDEKDTINDNAQQGQSDSESLGGIDLSILNPLNSWKSYFTNGCSVNIPIIAGWIHAPSSIYSSWWCSNNTLTTIKTNLTHILSIASVMIVFGFAFKWLRTNNGED